MPRVGESPLPGAGQARFRLHRLRRLRGALSLRRPRPGADGTGEGTVRKIKYSISLCGRGGESAAPEGPRVSFPLPLFLEISFCLVSFSFVSFTLVSFSFLCALSAAERCVSVAESTVEVPFGAHSAAIGAVSAADSAGSCPSSQYFDRSVFRRAVTSPYRRWMAAEVITPWR